MGLDSAGGEPRVFHVLVLVLSVSGNPGSPGRQASEHACVDFLTVVGRLCGTIPWAGVLS